MEIIIDFLFLQPENHSVGVETAAGPEEPLEKEVKRVLSVYASSHKVSIPTDPMSTPASTISFVSLSSNKSGIFAKKSPEFGKDIHKSSCLPQEKKAKAKQKVLKKQPQKWDKTNTHIVTCQTVKKKEDSGKTSRKKALVVIFSKHAFLQLLSQDVCCLLKCRTTDSNFTLAIYDY